MTKIVCPKCNTQAYDDTSFFCHACGAQLSTPVQGKKNAGDLSFGVKVLKKESVSARDDTPLSWKPGSIKRIKPVPDENRIYCTRCTAYVRDTPSKEEVLVTQPSVLKVPAKTPVTLPEISQETENRTIQEQHPAPLQEAGITLLPKASRWKIIIIVGAIAILFFMLMMIVMLMFTFWASVY
jgi:hypothetical protein